MKSRDLDQETTGSDQPTVFSLLQALPEPACIIKPDGRILLINTVLASWSGKTPEECSGKNIHDLIRNDSGLPLLAGSLEKLCTSALEACRSMVSDDESALWNVTVTPICSSSGAIENLFLSLKEIPEPLKSETKPGIGSELSHILLDSIPSSATIHDENLQLIARNRYAQDVLAGDDHHRNCVDGSETFNQEGVASLLHQYRQTLSTGKEHSCEVRLRPQGSTEDLWLMIRSRQIVIDGKTCVLSIGTDITDLKKAGENFKKYQEKISLALRATPAGLWELEPKSAEVSWCENVWSILGIDKGNSPASIDLFHKVIYPDDHEKVILAVTESVRTLSTIDIDYRVVHPDGSIRWMMSRGQPAFDQQGNFERYIGTVIDITERKQIELQMIENRRRLSFALEAARAGVWEWDLVTGENIWSDEIWTLYGVSPGAVEKPSFQLWADSIHPEDRERAVWVVTDAARQKSDLNVEYRTIHPDGSVHWLMSRGKPSYDGHGQAVGYIGTIIDITERKIIEIKLNESKLRFNFALEATGAGVWEWDVKTDRLFWSDQIWKLYGLEPQGNVTSHKLCGTNVHAEDQELTFQTITSASQRKVDFTVEYRVCHPDGSIRWLMCRGVPLRSSEGEAGSYLGMVMDITDRRRVEEGLRKSRNQLNMVIEKGDIGVWTVDLEDFTAQRSHQYSWIFGYDSAEGEWSLDAFLEHIVPEERTSIRNIIETCCITHENHTFECRIQTADKRLCWIWVFGTFNYDITTRRYYLSGIVQDITLRKQAEILLKESEQKFRNIFEFSPVAISIGAVDEGVVFDVNASWLRLFGYCKEEVVGRRYSDLALYLHPEDHHNIMHDLQKQGRVSNRQLEFRNKAGATITILLSAESITIAGQNNILLMLTDITVQELQQASISQLERAVAERTEQLQEEVERLRRFLSMISHEYRTPLAIIRGNLDLIDLKHRNGDFSREREMNKIRKAIERLVEVMEVSIQESRIMESQCVQEVTSFQLESAIVEQIEAFRSMWPERVISYSGKLGDAEISGQQGQFKMALFNLLDNARKYSPPETPIELEGGLENDEVVITIRNQGTSFNKTEGNELFEKYRRGSNAVNTGGAGIGLWLVREIIEHHHGTISLSGIESGVEAVIRLPLHFKKGLS